MKTRTHQETSISGIRVRLDANDQVYLSANDLARSRSAELRQLALVAGKGNSTVAGVGNGDAWVNEREVMGATGLSPRTFDEYRKIVSTARQQAFAAMLTTALRQHPGAVPGAPRSQGKDPKRLAAKPRSAYVPLADYLAKRFAGAKSYETSTEPASAIYYFTADDLLRTHSVHELAAACAILTAREGCEFSLVRDARGRASLVQGLPDRVELDEVLVGHDLEFHTHPLPGERAAYPSSGDNWMTSNQDPNKRGSAVSEDGFRVVYEANERGGVDIVSVERLWKASPIAY